MQSLDVKTRVRVAIYSPVQITGELLLERLSLEPRFQLLGSFSTTEDLAVYTKVGDLAVCDCSTEVTRSELIRAEKILSGRRLIVLWSSKAAADLRAYISLGAGVFVERGASVDEMMCAIDVASRGEPWVSPGLTAPLLRHSPEVIPLFCDSLTSREQEVAELRAQGLTYSRIGARLHVSTNTVKNHLHKIYQKAQGRAAFADDRPMGTNNDTTSSA